MYVQLDFDFLSTFQQLHTNFEGTLPPFRARPKQFQSQALYAVFRLSLLFCYIEHKRFSISHSCHFWLPLKFFVSICYPTPFFSYQRSFLGRISYLQFYMFFQNMTDKNQDISVKCSRKSNSFELSFHSLIQPTQLQRQLQEKTIQERISAGTKFMGKQWRKISECKSLL